MAKEKKKPTLASAGVELAGVGITTGLGAQIAGATDPVVVEASKGLTTLAKGVITAGQAMVGGILEGQLQGIQDTAEGKKKRKR